MMSWNGYLRRDITPYKVNVKDYLNNRPFLRGLS